MEVTEIMKVLKEDMGVAIFSSVDENNHPHARPINVGVANEKGVFFMTSPKTDFYSQITTNPNISITGLHKDGHLVQVIRINGKIRPVGKEKLQEILADNPYVDQVYPEESDRQSVQAFQLYEGKGFYHSLSQGHKYVFEIGE